MLKYVFICKNMNFRGLFITIIKIIGIDINRLKNDWNWIIIDEKVSIMNRNWHKCIKTEQ